MKVKFNRVKLIAALKKSKEDALVQYRKDVKVYHEQMTKSHAKLIENVEKYLSEIKRSKPSDVDTYSIGNRLTKNADFPREPKHPRMGHVEGLIQQLELGVDDVIVCDTKEEYVQLTQSCAILGTCKL